MKKIIEHPPLRTVFLLIVSLLFLTVNAQATEAGDKGTFYKSFLIEKSYAHPLLQTKSAPKQTATAKPASSPKASTAPKNTRIPFYSSFLSQKSYVHPGLAGKSSSISPTATAGHKTGGKNSVSSSPEKPKFDICKFVCLSTCNNCRRSSSNYLMSRE